MASGLLDGVAVAFLLEADAQLLVQPGPLAAQFPDRFARLGLEARRTAIEVVEAAGDFARKLDVRHLVLAHRHLVGAVDQDVGRLQQRVAEETVGGQILVFQFFLLVLVGRHPFQPAERRHHRQQQVQFRVLRHLRLDEQGGLAGVDPGRQPVDDHLPGRLLDALRIVVMGGQRVPVGDEEQAGVFVLEPDPVLEDPVVMAEVQRPGGAHAGKDTFCVHGCDQ
jgi:hypothetical protein